MSNPTTPFGWQMPENTDLVTDLPADFEVFGQAVATDLQYLLGGTTGQVLAKGSATDLDFDWVAPTAGDIEGVTAGIGISGGGTSGTVTVTNSMATAFTTSGDLIQATGSGTFARLATGTNGQYLTTNGTTNSWASVSAGGMTLLTTHTLSGSTSTISGISGSYKSLFGIISGVTTGAGAANWKIDPNGNTSITSSVTQEGNNGASNSYNYTGTWYMTIAATSKVSGGDNCWSFTIDNYASTTSHKPVKMSGQWAEPNNNKAAMDNGGGIYTNSAITSLDFVTLGGAWTAGTVLLYGVS